jgi:hypothetical protein
MGRIVHTTRGGRSWTLGIMEPGDTEWPRTADGRRTSQTLIHRGRQYIDFVTNKPVSPKTGLPKGSREAPPERATAARAGHQLRDKRGQIFNSPQGLPLLNADGSVRKGTAGDRKVKRQVIRERKAEAAGARTVDRGEQNTKRFASYKTVIGRGRHAKR